MTTGKFKCPLCNKLKNYNKESKYKISIYTNKNKPFQMEDLNICLDCFYLVKQIKL